MTNPIDEPPVTDVVEEESDGRSWIARVATGLVSLVTGLFALVLVLHIIFVVAEANMGNPFAQFVTDWARSIDLGLTNLFTPASDKLQVVLNEGIAALLWLVIGAVVNTIISRVLMPRGRRVWYRRRR